ncbi:hypothetical protein HRbin36_02850 [bacterium HR36]|nr:hypothetical protein HRbin36_02850 [bacterium HR36]
MSESASPTAVDETGPLISMVGLLETAVRLTERDVVEAARRAWQMDLGAGKEGPDGMVAQMSPKSIIVYAGDYLFLVNNANEPYVRDPESQAKNLRELRIQHLFRQHTAWMSCDMFGKVGGKGLEKSQHGDTSTYRQLGRLFAELMPAGTLLLYLTEIGQFFPVSEKTIAALRAEDPLQALANTREVPVVPVPADHPDLVQAQEEARRTWPQFVAAFEQGRGSHFSVKVPLGYGEEREYIWVEVEAIEGDWVYGKLSNEPVYRHELELGDRVRVHSYELNDWLYLDEQDTPVGGYTVRVLARLSGYTPPGFGNDT